MLCLLVAASVAVIRFFAADPRGETTWRRLVAPALAAVGLFAMVWVGVANYATLLGVEAGAVQAWALPGFYALTAVAGALYGIWLRSARPAVYQGIGIGAEARPEPLTQARSQARGRRSTDEKSE